MKKIIIKILLLMFLLSGILSAQSEPDSNQVVQTSDSIFVMAKSPWGAVLRSAVLPGWGQLYNESYLKVPVVWGIMGSLMYGWIFYNDQYKIYRDSFTATGIENDRKLRELYRDERDLFAIYIGLAYFLNLVDAYVDAQLFDFDVSENPFTHAPQFGIKFHF